MNWFAFSGLFCFVTALGLGLFSLLRGREFLHKIWGAFNFAVALWGISAFKFSTEANQENVFLWLGIGHVGVILIPVLYLHFVFHLLKIARPKILASVYALGLSFLAINFTDRIGLTRLFIVNLRYVFNSFFVDSPPGLLYFPFVLFFFSVVSYGLYCATRIYKISDGKKRSQIRLFIWSTVIGFLGGGTAFLMVFKVDAYPVFHFAIGLYPVILTYAIFRYQFLDIEVIVKRTLVFAGMALGMMAMIAFPTLATQRWLAQTGKVPSLILNLIGVALIILTYERMKTWLVNVTDRYLFQKKYDYKELLKKFTTDVMGIVDLHQLVQMTVMTFSDTIK